MIKSNDGGLHPTKKKISNFMCLRIDFLALRRRYKKPSTRGGDFYRSEEAPPPHGSVDKKEYPHGGNTRHYYY